MGERRSHELLIPALEYEGPNFTSHPSQIPYWGDLGGRLGEVANVVIPRLMTTSTLPEDDTVLMLADENLACGARITADI